MTNEEFIERIYAAASSVSIHKTYSAEEIENNIREYYSGVFNTSKIVERFINIGHVLFYRIEKQSNDKITFDIIWRSRIEYWQDINCVVNGTGFVQNCAGIIEWFFISEDGKFYNQDHKLISEDVEGFAEYITTVEYDYHPETTQRTYDMLRFFGWYEGRHIDTTAFEQVMDRRGIKLSEKQLAFFREFSGLYFSFDRDFWCFDSLEKIPTKELYYSEVSSEKNEYKVIYCGETMGGPLALYPDGILRLWGVPWGRTTMECINHLCEDVPEDYKWIPPDKD